MKKLTFLFAGLFLMANVASSQGIDDRAVIPVAVTLNSILRLNVVSGGNIEFNFNTLADYTNGIDNSEAYDTQFNVASSVDWEVVMYSEEEDLVGTDMADGSSVMPLDNIGYRISHTGSGVTADLYVIPSLSSTAALSNNEVAIIENGGTNAGDVGQNAFTIHWRCGTAGDGDMNPQSILEQNLSADRYATNVFLTLKPAP
ncbi:MAG: hypothetical protein EA361_01325 [Bacteroidetes bacterium]|nr:MAG: hypothetical protein EA361_01325 [Bacteroidota bacterium]